MITFEYFGHLSAVYSYPLMIACDDPRRFGLEVGLHGRAVSLAAQLCDRHTSDPCQHSATRIVFTIYGMVVCSPA